MSLMLFDASNVNKTLQDAVDQWVSRISMVEFSCECKEQLLLGSGLRPEMFYTKHREEYEILDTPDILHIKVQDREIRDNSIEIKEVLYLNGTRYVFNSAMLYEGSGNFGHWRCMAKFEDKSVILNDDHMPVTGSMIDLNLGTDLIFCRSDLYIRGHGFGKDKAIKELDTGSSSKFRCKVCEKGLAKSHFLRHHVLVDHRDNCCDECDEYFGNLEMLCKHIKAIHLEEDRTCVVCSERFDTTESVEQHIRLFHPISLSEEQQNDGVTNLNNIDSSIPPKQDNDYSPKKKFRTEDNSQSGQLYEPNEKYSASIQSKENVSTTSRIPVKKGVKILTKEILESEVQKSGGGIKIKRVESEFDKSAD